MPKTYLTAEEFDVKAQALQDRCDRFAQRASDFLVKKMRALYDELDEDQMQRVIRRAQAKQREAERPLIVHPGNHMRN